MSAPPIRKFGAQTAPMPRSRAVSSMLPSTSSVRPDVPLTGRTPALIAVSISSVADSGLVNSTRTSAHSSSSRGPRVVAAQATDYIDPFERQALDEHAAHPAVRAGDDDAHCLVGCGRL